MSRAIPTEAPRPEGQGGQTSTPVTVRDATFAAMRRLGMTTIFGNPGSTEIPFLTDVPDWIEYVLALHEGSVVGIASGYAIAREEPAMVSLHTAAGLGNAVNALANARDCRAPLVVVVGQQDRRLLASEPFLTGRGLEHLAGEYAVWSTLPARAQDAPGAIARAYHEAQGAGGPALVVVPMGDWDEPADELAGGAPARVVRPRSVNDDELAPLARLIASAAAPTLVVGAGASSLESWDALTALAERADSPVWQEPFASRPGFPHLHPLFAGDLPWMRKRLRETLAPHDLVLAVGTSAFRGYLFDDAVALTQPGTTVAVLTEDPSEAYRSPCELAVVAPIAEACAALARRLPAREPSRASKRSRPVAITTAQPRQSDRGVLEPELVFSELARILPKDVILVEETPSSRAELLAQMPARTPLGFLSNGGGGLGFGLSGAIGLRLATPDRPVVAVVGDGSAMYVIQSLWSASRYGVGVLVVIMANDGYAVMDRLAEARGGNGAWPSFAEVDLAGIARCLDCRSITVRTRTELTSELEAIAPTLRELTEPLVLTVELDRH